MLRVVTTQDKTYGEDEVINILCQTVDSNTLLLLSGGTTPEELYKRVAKDRIIKPGAVALVDERFGKEGHPRSNELMIEQTGLIKYLEDTAIPFNKILKNGVDLRQVADEYNAVINALFKKYSKIVAIMGIGVDGHTAGLMPGLEYDHSKLVVGYIGSNEYGARITLTFEALEKISEFVVLAFGSNKKTALIQSQNAKDQSSVPAVFYRKTSKQVYLITDQKID